ncbi:DUF6950 family protein [Shinella sp. G-2]|uniref:DUF6950 family protein n=1 Tax=Shinella sp. G-2 TaxID=3133141 RepID=UPI003D01FAA4
MTPAALTRLPNWRSRLEAVMDDIRLRPFEWHTHDCGRGLAARVVMAVTGVDIGAQYDGEYHDAASAARLIRSHGFASLGDLVASLLPAVHPSQAQLGDIAAIRMDGPIGHALGVVNGERILVLMDIGYGTVDLLDAEVCFKVG